VGRTAHHCPAGVGSGHPSTQISRRGALQRGTGRGAPMIEHATVCPAHELYRYKSEAPACPLPDHDINGCRGGPQDPRPPASSTAINADLSLVHGLVIKLAGDGPGGAERALMIEPRQSPHFRDPFGSVGLQLILQHARERKSTRLN